MAAQNSSPSSLRCVESGSEIEGFPCGFVRLLEAETLESGEIGGGNGDGRECGGSAADGLGRPIDVPRCFEDLIDDFPDAMVLAGEAGLEEAFDIALATRAGLNNALGFADEVRDKVLEFAFLLAAEGG